LGSQLTSEYLEHAEQVKRIVVKTCCTHWIIKTHPAISTDITSLAFFAHFPFSAALAASSKSINLLWSLQREKMQLRDYYADVLK
jgi:hypothetical protein